MRNGLYKVEFQTPLGSGSGVVVLHDGRIRGGDSIIYYVGTYTENGNQFSAEVRTDSYAKVPGMTSVFGMDKVNIKLQGASNGDTAALMGKANEVPNVGFQAKLSRLCD